MYFVCFTYKRRWVKRACKQGLGSEAMVQTFKLCLPVEPALSAFAKQCMARGIGDQHDSPSLCAAASLIMNASAARQKGLSSCVHQKHAFRDNRICSV